MLRNRQQKHTANPLAFIVKRQNSQQNNMEFLLHKDKEKGNPPHIQAHLAALTHGRLLRC